MKMYDYLRAIVSWRKFILLAAFSGAFIAAVVSLLLPKWYTATTSVFPPEPKSSISPYAQLLQNLQAPIFGPTAVGARPGTIYIDILKSRKVGERVIEEFGFKEIYGVNLMSDALDLLRSHTFFTLLENGLLFVSFEDRDPRRAAQVTNRYVELLDEFNRELGVTRASRKREFIEGQLERQKEELVEAEEALKKFQQKNHAVQLDEQTRAAIEIVAGITGEAIKLEVELELLRHYTSLESEEYTRKKKRYEELLSQLSAFQEDSTRSEEDVIRSFFPPLERVPRVALEYARLLRNVKVGEKVYELLVTEYQQARIEEARDTPTVQILDTATPPELRSRPRRKLIVFLGGLLGLAWACVVAVFSTFLSKGSGRKETLEELVRPIVEDLRRIFRIGRR